MVLATLCSLGPYKYLVMLVKGGLILSCQWLSTIARRQGGLYGLKVECIHNTAVKLLYTKVRWQWTTYKNKQLAQSNGQLTERMYALVAIKHCDWVMLISSKAMESVRLAMHEGPCLGTVGPRTMFQHSWDWAAHTFLRWIYAVTQDYLMMYTDWWKDIIGK